MNWNKVHIKIEEIIEEEIVENAVEINGEIVFIESINVTTAADKIIEYLKKEE